MPSPRGSGGRGRGRGRGRGTPAGRPRQQQASSRRQASNGVTGSPSSRQLGGHRSASVRRISQAEALAAAADVEATYEHHAYNDDDQTYGVATLGASTIRTDDVGASDVTQLYAICESALPGPDDPPMSEMTPKQRSVRESQLEQAWEALREWLTAHPTDEERSVAATHLGQFSTTALHLLCKLPDPPVDVVEGIIACEKEVAGWQDSNGWIPLHHSVANGASVEVLKLLCEAYPGGKVTQDKRLRTPLHFAFFRSQIKGGKGGRGGTAKSGMIGSKRVLFGDDGAQSNDNGGEDDMVEIVALLGDTGAARLPDENGMIPLHYGELCNCTCIVFCRS